MNFFDLFNEKKSIICIISVILNILLIIVVVFLTILYTNYECICNEVVDKDIVLNEDESNNEFYVDVKGEVKNPGVYLVNNSNIINDVITLSGGFTKNAYKNNINLSKKVSNELVIYVYSKNEYKKKTVDNEITKCETSSYDLSNCLINTTSSEIVVSDNDTIVASSNNNNNNEELTSNTVNINTATKEELTSLSGIGESKAEDIINYRNTVGPFNKIEDIKNVSGIAGATFEKIKDKIVV